MSIQKSQSKTSRKIPILGDIPGLKLLFAKRDQESQDDELLVFLRPRVIKAPADARKLLREIDRRDTQMKQWQGEQIPSKN